MGETIMDVVTLGLAKNYTNTKTGDLSTLTTTEKTNIVGSVNELNSIKAEKAQSPTEGHIATLDTDGNPVDGGTALSSINSQLADKATSEQGALADTAVQPDSAIYTVTWDKGSSPTLTGVGRMGGATVLCGVDATPAVVSTVTISGTAIDTYDNYIKSSLFDWPEVTDIYGNVFIKIPKTYLGKTDGAGSKTWSASRKPFTGSYLPKCFWDFTNSRELDYVLVGKYPASLSTDTTKLESKPDVFPLVLQNIVQFRTLAQANNTGGLSGYQQLDIHVVDLLQTLWIIQNATLHSQSKCAGFTSGQYSATHVATATESAANRIIVANAHAELYAVGQTIGIGTSLGGNQIASNRLITSIDVVDASNKAISFDGAAVTVTAGNILYNLAYKNGFSSLFASSYATKTSISAGKHSFVWNGIESLWGNIFQFVDGVNINELQAWVCENADNYASNLFAAPYVSLSYANGGTDGYIKEIGYDGTYPYAALPTTVGGDYQTYYSDYYVKNAGQRVARVGGVWVDGAGAGLFYWNLDSSSSNARVNVGSRLLKKPL